ncbi:MAG TPA: helix-turn-helix domain-containing protein [Candidatus Blautia merdigallinarum]|uniref:Helix-turn-helix domain-containing protein n=1 Tax=Candidatus Blautia merdigallinarum TaxID=2838495 RepID=A0A9D2SJF9_9FIRM|nr:helix-turn-helix domain-containing protein [Candidatus Blautia merdigallinarum]
MKSVNKVYRFRIYPTEEQETLLKHLDIAALFTIDTGR